MITFNGSEELIKKVYDNNQEHVFEYWDSLGEKEKQSLIEELRNIDFDLMKKLFGEKEEDHITDYTPAPTIRPEEFNKDEVEKAIKAGEDHIRQGKLAAFLVAGGQGSRLGFDGPKGKFPVGPVSEKTLFHFHGEKIRAYEIKYNTQIPYLVMTSVMNHNETVSFFEKNDYFGLEKERVFIFSQNMIPSLDTEGKLILKDKSSLFTNPDGHGGSLSALKSSGALDKLIEMGIETVSYFQVDNPLVKIADPLFTGFHLLNSAEISSKAIPKAYAEEKTGVFIKTAEGKTGIIEYSDMPEEKLQATDQSGRLQYSAGNTAIHLFSTEFISKITGESNLTLPFHRANKKIKAFVSGDIKEIDGIKYEKFIFDALPICKKDVVFETVREEEFAPVKNAEGKDSPDSAKKLISDLCKKWVADSGIKIPDGLNYLEISPLFSVDGEGIPSDTVLDQGENIYLE